MRFFAIISLRIKIIIGRPCFDKIFDHDSIQIQINN